LNRINAPMINTLNLSPETQTLFVSKFVYPVVKFPLRFPRLAGCREALRFGGFGPAQRSRRARGWVMLYTGLYGMYTCIQNPVYSTGVLLETACSSPEKVTHHGPDVLHDARR
jgi:hypothetical protein